MSDAMLRIFVRVVKKRLADGENMDNILSGYTALSDDDRQRIREAAESHT